MAGRSKGPTRPAQKELREAYDELLRAAAGFDKLTSRRSLLGDVTGGAYGRNIPGTGGDRLREEAATALKVIVRKALDPAMR